MPITVACSSCNRKLRVPDDLLGKRVKCPTCGNTFEATAEDEAPPEPPPEPVEEGSSARSKSGSRRGEAVTSSRARRDDDYEDDDQPRSRRGRDDDDYEDDRDEDDDRRRSRRRRREDGRDYEPHRGPMVLVFGIIGCVLFVFEICVGWIGLPGAIIAIVLSLIGMGLSVTAWVLGGKDLGLMRKGKMDPEGRGNTQGGYVCGIIGTVLNAITLGCCLLGIFGLLAFLGIGLGASSIQRQQQRPPGKIEAPMHRQSSSPLGGEGLA